MADIKYFKDDDGNTYNFRDDRVDLLDDFYVLKAGDTMTGDLTVFTEENPSFYIKSSYSGTIGDNVPSTGVSMGRFLIRDVNEDAVVYMDGWRSSADKLTAAFEVRRKNASGTLIRNNLGMSIDASGNSSVSMTHPQAWRDTLEIGAQQYITNGSTVSVPTASDTTLCNTGSLESGYHYIILAEVAFANNSSGRRAIFLASSSTGSNIDRYCKRTQPPISGDVTQIQLVYLCHPSSNTTYYLRAYQNSGSALNATGGLRVFKLSAWS